MKYDIIIAGAGPAGLSLAAELSKDFKILVLEKAKLGICHKSWLSFKDRIEKLGLPKEVISLEWTDWWGMVDDFEFVVKDSFVSVDEHKVLAHWEKICRKQGVVIKEETPLKDFKTEKDHVCVNGKYNSRLLIDCTGVKSPLIEKHNIIENITYLSCCGAVVETKHKSKNFYRVVEKYNGAWMNYGVTALGKNRYFLLTFSYNDDKIKLADYIPLLNKYSKKYFTDKFKVIEHKIDYYATGELKQQTFDRVYLAGDAGLHTPGFIGMGFNEILRQHKKVAKHITKCLEKDELSQEELAIPSDIAQDSDSRFFRIMSNMVNCFSRKTLVTVTKEYGSVGNKTLQHLYRNTLSDDEMIKMIIHMFSKVNQEELIRETPTHRVVYMVEELAKLSEELLTEELHDLIFKHHKIRIPDILK